ncbi:MAG: hypothetical protein JO104_06030, partial [Candidatus Eremiobacteraeota bacterium]|nr:hypothetical protein [Candidatus Eremiobacteraeota bacterium]
MKSSGRLAAIAAAAFAVIGAACSNGSSAPIPQSARQTARRASASPITHVVFIIEENRSFNNLFMGYPGATTQNYGYD